MQIVQPNSKNDGNSAQKKSISKQAKGQTTDMLFQRSQTLYQMDMSCDLYVETSTENRKKRREFKRDESHNHVKRSLSKERKLVCQNRNSN